MMVQSSLPLLSRWPIRFWTYWLGSNNFDGELVTSRIITYRFMKMSGSWGDPNGKTPPSDIGIGIIHCHFITSFPLFPPPAAAKSQTLPKWCSAMKRACLVSKFSRQSFVPQSLLCHVSEVCPNVRNLRAVDYSTCWGPAVGMLLNSVWD